MRPLINQQLLRALIEINWAPLFLCVGTGSVRVISPLSRGRLACFWILAMPIHRFTLAQRRLQRQRSRSIAGIRVVTSAVLRGLFPSTLAATG
jgi:hypothetical protein